MARIVLIHWKPAEAGPHVRPLRELGHSITVCAPAGGQGLQPFRADPPDYFVIDLSRLPSQGRAVGMALRQYKDTRLVPLIFAGGESSKVEATRAILPDAAYTEWSDIVRALGRAAKMQDPVVPGTMAGYSGTPLPKKLGIKAGSTVTLLHAPEGFERTLGELPESVTLKRSGPAATILLFVKSCTELEKHFAAAARSLAAGGGLWIVWPKKTSPLASDIGEAEVRAFGLGAGFVDYKICAVDATWSGLLFARRKAKAAKRG